MPTADDVGAMPKWDLLWQNANPSVIGAFDVTDLPLSTYSFVAIVFISNMDSGSQNLYTQIFKISTYPSLLQVVTASAARQSREFTFSDTTIAFANGYSGSSANTKYCVPIEIYGIKGINTLLTE